MEALCAETLSVCSRWLEVTRQSANAWVSQREPESSTAFACRWAAARIVSGRRLNAVASDGRVAQRLRVSTRIRSVRQALGLGQDQFAAILGVSQSRLAHWETGRGAPQLSEFASDMPRPWHRSDRAVWH